VKNYCATTPPIRKHIVLLIAGYVLLKKRHTPSYIKQVVRDCRAARLFLQYSGICASAFDVVLLCILELVDFQLGHPAAMQLKNRGNKKFIDVRWYKSINK
jgi:hypothetical protein